MTEIGSIIQPGQPAVEAIATTMVGGAKVPVYAEVRQQPASPACEGCGLDNCEHVTQPAEPVSDVLDLVRQYAQKRVAAAVLRLDDADEAAELRAEEHAVLWSRLEAEVQRLRAEREDERRAQEEELTALRQRLDDVDRARDFLTNSVVRPARAALDAAGVGGYKMASRIAALAAERDEALAKRDQMVENAEAWKADNDRLRARIHEAVKEADARGAARQSELAKLQNLMAEARSVYERHRQQSGTRYWMSELQQAFAAAVLAERDEARAEAERLKNPDPTDPLVLSLPQVPEGAVALVGAKTGMRYEPSGDGWQQVGAGPGWRFEGVAFVLANEGSVTVVMREPRTWPAFTGAVEGLRVRGQSGEVYTFRSDQPCVTAYANRYGCSLSLGTLAEVDGPLVEVFDDKDGTP